jgi:hypothetical protein
VRHDHTHAASTTGRCAGDVAACLALQDRRARRSAAELLRRASPAKCCHTPHTAEPAARGAILAGTHLACVAVLRLGLLDRWFGSDSRHCGAGCGLGGRAQRLNSRWLHAAPDLCTSFTSREPQQAPQHHRWCDRALLVALQAHQGHNHPHVRGLTRPLASQTCHQVGERAAGARTGLRAGGVALVVAWLSSHSPSCAPQWRAWAGVGAERSCVCLCLCCGGGGLQCRALQSSCCKAHSQSFRSEERVYAVVVGSAAEVSRRGVCDGGASAAATAMPTGPAQHAPVHPMWASPMGILVPPAPPCAPDQPIGAASNVRVTRAWCVRHQSRAPLARMHIAACLTPGTLMQADTAIPLPTASQQPSCIKHTHAHTHQPPRSSHLSSANP